MSTGAVVAEVLMWWSRDSRLDREVLRVRGLFLLLQCLIAPEYGLEVEMARSEGLDDCAAGS